MMTPNAVTLVAGPPCSGKSTYVAQRFEQGDLLIASDEIAQALSREPEHVNPEHLKEFVWAAFWAVLKEVRHTPLDQHAWVILSAPTLQLRHDFRRIDYAHVVVMSTPREICEQRVNERFRAWDARRDAYLGYIDEWFRRYEPDPRDEQVSGT
jgi:predicted kinase